MTILDQRCILLCSLPVSVSDSLVGALQSIDLFDGFLINYNTVFDIKSGSTSGAVFHVHRQHALIDAF